MLYYSLGKAFSEFFNIVYDMRNNSQFGDIIQRIKYITFNIIYHFIVSKGGNRFSLRTVATYSGVLRNSGYVLSTAVEKIIRRQKLVSQLLLIINVNPQSIRLKLAYVELHDILITMISPTSARIWILQTVSPPNPQSRRASD